MATSSGSEFRVPVSFEGRDAVSPVLVAVAGGLDNVADELHAVQAAADGVETKIVRGAVQVSNGAKQMAAGLGESARSNTVLLQNLGRVISDMPYGIMGVANNVEALAASWSAQTAAAGGAMNVIKGIIGSLGGPAGLAMVGIPIVTSLAVAFGDDLVRAVTAGGESVESLENKLEDISKYSTLNFEIGVIGMSKLDALEFKLRDIEQRLRDVKRASANQEIIARGPGYGDFGSSIKALVTGDYSEIQRNNDAYYAAFQDEGTRMQDRIRSMKAGTSVVDVKTWNAYSKALGSTPPTAAEINIAQLNWEHNKITRERDAAREDARTTAKGGSSSGGSGRSSGVAVKDDFAEVMESLDEERKKLTMTAEEYRVYQLTKQAGVQAGSAQAEAIRAEVASLEALSHGYKDSSAALSDLLDRPDLIIQFGTRSDAMLQALGDGVQNWIDSLSAAFADMVITAETSFDAILESFTQMMIQIMLEAAVFEPLKGAVSDFFKPQEESVSMGELVGGDASDIPGFATGGVVGARSGGTIVRVAEAGDAEAIVPLPDGRSIPVDWRGGTQMTGVSSIRVEVVNQSSTPVKASSMQPQLDAQGYVIRVVLSDISSNGPIRQAMAAVAQGGG
jgi:hypothetical protein